MNEELIAPCGMNCGICSGHLAYKHDVKSQGIRMPYCPGCRPRDKKCAFLKKRCHLLSAGQVQYCYQCPDFPCPSLSHLDKRYRTLFRMSMIENLEYIKQHGTKQFLKQQEENWKCDACGAVICCHNGICYHCDLDRLRNKKQPYRWEDEA